ncbi:hypothetical protein CPB84DRAFT_1712291 [Gymnopilus junonius]|uniref:Response regulatory domain-containing protein n=1 Tax=Gymnopilus junonius TaxID=109634 RepID=A0A9P5NJC8_GYMJU|nr:hypothetical protein CPB84DRAFT_1712291 [Gymnopilus junonius]
MDDRQQQQQQQQQAPDRAPTQSPWSMMMTMPGFNGSAFGGETEGPGVDLNQEGLQVYTVGHLLPKDSYVEDAQGNWSFDPSSLSSASLLGGLGMSGAAASGSGSNAASSSTTADVAGGSGLQDFTDDTDEVVRPTPSNALVSSSSSGSSSLLGSGLSDAPATGGAQKLRVRRSTFVPGWAVPPRVLLVDDDAVSRKLSSKFLKVFGCTIDVAVDGIGAVNKMNLEKYDLVLMDIVMPKLDGVSATNLIRKFDQGTPIISMTSNSKPNEIMKYYSSGMNDILPKPFTKEGLLEMLEKHLMHLKVIQQMAKIPRSVGVPPLSDANFEQALAMSANNFMQFQQGSSLLSPRPVSGATSSLDLLSSSKSNASEAPMSAPSPFNFQFFGDGSDDDLRINPLAGMGLTDEQYNMILQNIMNGEGFMGMMDSMSSPGSSSSTGSVSEKRPLEDGEDDRRGKRSRFEVIE